MKAAAALSVTPCLAARGGRPVTGRRASMNRVQHQARGALRVRAVAAPDKPTTAERGDWAPDSWQKYEAKQQPTWPSQEALDVRPQPHPRSPLRHQMLHVHRRA